MQVGYKRSVTLSNDGITCTVTEEPVQNINIWGYVTLIKQALVGVGFHPENVDDLFTDEERWTKHDFEKRD